MKSLRNMVLLFLILNFPDVSGFKTILRLHKQRYLCKHCMKAFTLSTPITNYGYFISNNTVERVMDSYYESQKLYKHYLPQILSFDEFKSVKSADGAMRLHICNGITGQTIDIVEDRRLDNLIKYFYYYDYKARSRVKFIIIDMYSPYISLIKKCFLMLILLLINFILLS